MLNEIVHSMRNKKCKVGWIGIKVNMHKAYDSVEWNVLCGILDNLGFSPWFIHLVFVFLRLFLSY